VTPRPPWAWAVVAEGAAEGAGRKPWRRLRRGQETPREYETCGKRRPKGARRPGLAVGLREHSLADDGGAAGRRSPSRGRDSPKDAPGDLVVGDDGSDLEPAGAALNVNVEGPGEQRSSRHVRGGGVEQSAFDALEVAGHSTFGSGTVAPSMLHASAVADTGKPTGTTGPGRSRGSGRSPTAARGEGGSEREDERALVDDSSTRGAAGSAGASLSHEVSQSPEHDPNPLDDVCSALRFDHADFVFFFVLDWAAERRRCCRSPGRIARPGHPFSLRGTAIEVCETTCQTGLRWRA
jgi:hypothetical protein